MGSGIAQVAATYGHQVRLLDQDSSALDRALASIEKISRARSRRNDSLMTSRMRYDHGLLPCNRMKISAMQVW